MRKYLIATDDEEIRRFFADWQPSSMESDGRSDMISWLQTYAPDYPNVEANFKEMYARKHEFEGWDQSRVQMDQEGEGRLKQLAIDTKETSGKWMMKTTADKVDALWEMLAMKVRKRFFGRNASLKCSTRVRSTESNTYTLCLYTIGGWENLDEVRLFREKLRVLGADELCVCPLYWKPDIYTHMQLFGTTYLLLDGVDNGYSRDHWREKPF